MKPNFHLLFALICGLPIFSTAQEVPILHYTLDANNRAQITVASTEDHYYVLHVRHSATGNFEQATALAFGQNGNTTLTEPLAAYPLDYYKVTEHALDHPADADADGRNDLEEWADLATSSPFNAAFPIDFKDGVTCIPDRTIFKTLSFQDPQVGGPQALEQSEIIKFFIHNRDNAEPELYFINSNTHTQHTHFANAIGYTNDGTLMTGTLVFHPFVVAPNGGLGTYRILFESNQSYTFEYVQKAMELMAANLPFLKNNLCYYPLEQVGLPLYFQEEAKYTASRIHVLFEADLYENLNYLALNAAESYGLLRVMDLQETPHSRDIVLYEALPNELPRVGGMITTVMQTPLSHVNLRAIQDNVPNAFIRTALQEPAIDSLIGKYVYYRADRQGFTLREASLAEVDAFYTALRPTEIQRPVRDLSQTKIKSLDSISFAESASYGVKCANVATMRRLGFPEGTIPEGFGVPFYFYDAFMQFNGFYVQAQEMLNDPLFRSDFEVQMARLKAFRQSIKDGIMPNWMMDALTQMQESFPVGASIRCRSSTNNEDLPGFSGAGLYDSYTQHPDEGHIAKSIKQVYASMWNFRAFDEREFYRVDHNLAAMGILVHENFENERANGVGVSTDPLYQTKGTYYLNTQLGSDLVTNPNALSIPEEILLDAVSVTDDDYFLINPSNLVPADSLIMQEGYLDQMRTYLGAIHQAFQELYQAEGKEGFAMEIEYKIDANGQLSIKQARPWASFWAKTPIDTGAIRPMSGLKVFPNPFHDKISLQCACETEVTLEVYSISGQKVFSTRMDFRKSQQQISLGFLAQGVYILVAMDDEGQRYLSGKVVKW